MTRPQRRLAAAAAIVAVLLLVVLATTTTSRADTPPAAACAVGPDGQPQHCRCLYSDPVGLPVDDPADCPASPTPTTIVDCIDPSGAPCSTTTTVYVPTPADVNDVPADSVPVEPRFTG